MNEKFTRGPWIFGYTSDHNGCCCVDATDPLDRGGNNIIEICAVYGEEEHNVLTEMAAANAHLIAAAPELYAALDNLLNCVDGQHDPEWLNRC